LAGGQERIEQRAVLTRCVAGPLCLARMLMVMMAMAALLRRRKRVLIGRVIAVLRGGERGIAPTGRLSVGAARRR
jgi:hypothetical protein